MPYVTYNLCPACSAGRGGQRSPWAEVVMGTTSGSFTPSLPPSLPRSLLAAIAHLKAELSGISLCQGPYSSALFPHSALQLRLPLFPLRACTHAQTRARSRCNGDICKQWHLDACMLAHGSTSAHGPANTLAGKLVFFGRCRCFHFSFIQPSGGQI